MDRRNLGDDQNKSCLTRFGQHLATSYVVTDARARSDELCKLVEASANLTQQVMC